MKGGGFNPMRWDCEKRECFNKKRRPKIELFADCFPRNISFGDVDAEVEINGHFLQLEWKTYIGSPPGGQLIKFHHYTRRPGFNVIVVCGDAETMKIEAFQIWDNGDGGAWTAASFHDLKSLVARWANWAQHDDFSQSWLCSPAASKAI